MTRFLPSPRGGLPLALLAIAALGFQGPALAAPSAPPAAPTTAGGASQSNIIVEAGVGRVITLPAPVANVFVSDPKIVEVRPASPTSLFVFGVAPGRTTVAALDANGQTVRQIEITVRPSATASGEAIQAIAKATPKVTAQIDPQPRRSVISGKAPSPMQAHTALATAQAFVPEGQPVDNQLRIAAETQVGLRVRIAEISRNVTRAMGINWQAIGNVGKLGVGLATGNAISAAAGTASTLSGSYSDGRGNGINGLIDALANDNLIRVLAEPNLTAMSGEAASFLVGGEFPVPIGQNGGTLTVEFKQYGVALAFVPTVMSGERIRIKVRPEVSQLTTQGAVQMGVGANAITIPALSVRRAETTIELGSGQSFAMAGLLMDNTNQSINALPGIGEVPILGALFRSDSFVRNETELVIIVTPYIARPVSDPTALRLPTDGIRLPSDLERILLLRQVGIGSSPRLAQRLPGQAGFVVE
ncbi:MAG: type II and III secretion system protein family protein [Alphaproteobacteria bacterium]|nr:type II and III secretion system protein family protein [Alphaproteobacteria bacterium]